MELIYQYKVKDNELCVNIFNIEYFQYDNLIVAFERHQFCASTFNLDTKQFTPFEQYRQVQYEELAHKNHMYEYFDHVIIVDVPNKSYAKSCRFPYSVTEINGNYVVSCWDERYFYIFHSKTPDYETGVFIFDIENNIINQADFSQNEKFEDDQAAGAAGEIYQSEYSNIFTALHDHDISNCCFYKGNILITIEDSVYQYNIKTNELTLILNDDRSGDARVKNDRILIKSYHNRLHLYDGVLKEDIITHEEKYCYYHDFYQDNIITITGDVNGKIIRLYK